MRHGEKMFETLLTREELIQGAATRVTTSGCRSTRASLDYELYVEQGESTVAQLTDYDSTTTRQLTVEETGRGRCCGLPEIQALVGAALGEGRPHRRRRLPRLAHPASAPARAPSTRSCPSRGRPGVGLGDAVGAPTRSCTSPGSTGATTRRSRTATCPGRGPRGRGRGRRREPPASSTPTRSRTGNGTPYGRGKARARELLAACGGVRGRVRRRRAAAERLRRARPAALQLASSPPSSTPSPRARPGGGGPAGRAAPCPGCRAGSHRRPDDGADLVTPTGRTVGVQEVLDTAPGVRRPSTTWATSRTCRRRSG